ncbi:MAG: family 20 glycosylhydrolase [Chitinophagaceae bacterium]|nr:family 20 glycosylhydrolase [Chitinophagaceae bacterium]
MTLLKRNLFLFLLLISAYASAAGINNFEKNFKLSPQPQQVEMLAGKGLSAFSLQSVYLQGTAQKPVLQGILASLPHASRPGTGTLTLQLSDNSSLPASREGYVMEIKNGQVLASARSQAGLFYACQTLLQLLEDARDQKIVIPAVRITDYPDIDYRAVHIDLKHHLDAGYYYYSVIDRLAAFKINAIIIEFEDKLRYRKSPVVGADHAISIEEFAAISRYAKERNIEISPLVQGLGHASFILKHEQYKDIRDTITSDWSFDPMNPKTYEVQFSLYEDAIKATPYGKYLHVGGDEVGNIGMSELSKKSGLSHLQLNLFWLNKVSEFAVKHNRIPIFWDDMTFKLADLYRTTWDETMSAQEVDEAWAKNESRLNKNIKLFPKECRYMRWNYDYPGIPGNLRALDWYKSNGLKAIAATAAQFLWPMVPRRQSNFATIKDFSRITAEKDLEGILCTAWDDCSPHAETYFRGFHSFAFFTWNYSDAKADDVHALFRWRFYAPALSSPSLAFQDELEQAIAFWDTALVVNTHRFHYPKEINLIELPDPQKNGAWSQKYKTRVASAKKEIDRHQLISDRLGKAIALARRNEYALLVFNQINELQIYPARLLLLLDKYDNAGSAAAKSAAKKEIENYTAGFSQVRKNFEEAFTKTRILSNPEGYQLDQNWHDHLANGTVNSDWMYVYELAMNTELAKWLSK